MEDFYAGKIFNGGSLPCRRQRRNFRAVRPEYRSINNLFTVEDAIRSD